MIIKLENFEKNINDLLRRAGYIFQKKTGNETSFVRPLGRSGFPRFHLFASVEQGGLVLKLHLDQKKATYGQSQRHHGEYADDGPVSEEARRIESMFEK